MQALRVTDAGTVLADVPRPEPAGEEVVSVLYSGICNTDLEIARGYAGFRGTIGHEFVGVRADGTRVVGEINAGCGTCARCAAGDPRHCPTRTVLGIVGRDGAHAEQLRLPARNLLPVPAGVSDLAAVFVEPLAAACGVLERAPQARTGKVCVIGDGKLGLLCARVLAAAGARPLLVGRHPEKLALAGCETTTARPPRGFDVVVECSGNADGFSLALDLLRPQGTLVLKSTFAGATPVDAARIVVEELEVIGSRCGRFAPALDLLARGDVAVEDLISDVVPLAHADAALERAARPGVLKVLLRT